MKLLSLAVLVALHLAAGRPLPSPPLNWPDSFHSFGQGGMAPENDPGEKGPANTEINRVRRRVETTKDPNILKMHIGGDEQPVPINLAWTLDELKDRMYDIPDAGRLATCVLYCRRTRKIKRRQNKCINYCAKFVVKVQDQEEAERKGRNEEPRTTPWLPILVQPPSPALRRREAKPDDQNFANISRTQMDRAVVAYDCSVPTLLETVQIPEKKASDCGEQRTRVLRQRNATLNILQQVETVPLQVYRCRVRKTTIPTGCGMHSHQWLVHPMVEIEKDQVVSPTLCKQWWDHQEYVDPRGKKHRLQRNSKNRIYSYLAGNIDTTSANFGYCSGETVRMADGVMARSMVVSQHQTIEMFRFDATSDRRGRIYIPQDDRKLPCNVLAESCATDSGSYFWEKVDFNQHCPLYQTRTSSGIIVTDEGGRQSFLSRDNSLIRLRLRGVTVMCNQTVWETNFQKIVATEDTRYPDFNRPLTQASEASLVTYVNAQDYFLAGFLTERIQREHDIMQKNECLQLVEERQLDYASLAAAQNVPVEGTTVALGAGFFASSRGDAFVKYRCKTLLAMARNVDRCYAALPVTLQPEDANAYRLARGWPVGTNATEVNFFVTPNSHLLTTKGIEVECIPMMAPMFRGAYGSWITHTPDATFVSAEPAKLQLTRQEVEEADKWELPDFEQGGVYEPDFVLALDRQRQLSRAAADVAVTLGRKAEETGWTSGTLVGHYGGLNLPGLSIPSVWEILWEAFSTWGIIVAGLIGILGLAYLITCCSGMFCRLRGERFHPRATRRAHVAVAVFPSLGPYLRRRNPRYVEPRGEVRLPFMDRQPAGAIEDHRPPAYLPILPTNELNPSPTRKRSKLPTIPENSFGNSNTLAPRRQLLHLPALGTAPPPPVTLQECLQRIQEFEDSLRAEPEDAQTGTLTTNVLREVLHLKGQVTRAIENNKPVNEVAIAKEIGDIRRRYFHSKSQVNSPFNSRTPSPEDSDSTDTTAAAE